MLVGGQLSVRVTPGGAGHDARRDGGDRHEQRERHHQTLGWTMARPAGAPIGREERSPAAAP
jgi:hypothetical protein